MQSLRKNYRDFCRFQCCGCGFCYAFLILFFKRLGFQLTFIARLRFPAFLQQASHLLYLLVAAPGGSTGGTPTSVPASTEPTMPAVMSSLRTSSPTSVTGHLSGQSAKQFYLLKRDSKSDKKHAPPPHVYQADYNFILFTFLLFYFSLKNINLGRDFMLNSNSLMPAFRNAPNKS